MSERNIITIPVTGRIDSYTSSGLQTKVDAALAQHPDGIIFDFDSAAYISSAGLRVLLNAKKTCGKTMTMKVINVPLDIRNIFDMTGFSAIMDVEDKFRQVNVDGCPMIGAGACGECYRLDDETIIKLYYDRISDDTIAEEKRLAKLAFVLGIPTAISYDIVKVGTRKGVIYELIKAKTLSEIIREDYSKLDEYTKQYAEFCRSIHSTVCTGQNLPDFREVNRADIANIRGITAEEAAALNEFLDFVPDGNTCLHGDLNPNNIMLENGSLCLIDMGEFSRGFAMFDVSRIMFSLHFANGRSGTMNDFMKMPCDEVDRIWNCFVKYYFSADTLEEAAKTNPAAAWVEPLGMWRCVASMLKGTRWPEERRQQALGYLHEKLLPLVQQLKENGGDITKVQY